MRARWLAAGLVGCVIAGDTPLLFAESRPIQELPGDVVEWSTMWRHIPQEISAVGREFGPLVAVAWGPARGTAAMLESSGRKLWKTVKADTRPGHASRERNVNGVIFRYEF